MGVNLINLRNYVLEKTLGLALRQISSLSFQNQDVSIASSFLKIITN